jgi:hypothetical protein
MPDIVENTRVEITRRLGELEPLVDEYNRLDAAAKALDAIGPGPPGKESAAARRRRPGRPPGSGRNAATKATSTRAAKAGAAKAGRPARKPRPGSRKRSGTRAADALAAVKDQPGITIKELGAKLGISPNYLYRVMPGLEEEKKVTRRGTGWHPG